MKTCTKCKIEKPFSEYHKSKSKKDGYRHSCKECMLIYSKKYYQENKEDKIQKVKKYYQENKDKINFDKEKRKEYIKKRRENDPQFKLSTNIRSLIRKSFLRKGYSKNTKAANILGCSYEKFKSHIESQFENWMTWDNKGLYNGELNYGWDIDHIIPVSSATTEDELIKLNHYTNLQPLCSKVNRDIKKDKI